MKVHGDCTDHVFRSQLEDLRSIGKVVIEVCNNCLSVKVRQRRSGEEFVDTIVEMKDSAYPYVK